MKKTLLLSAMLTTLLAPLPMVVAHAQTQSGGIDDRRANTRANRRAAQESKAKAAEQLFPQATRQEPKASDSVLHKELDKLQKLAEDQKSDEVIALADQMLANPKASAVDRSYAAYYASNAWLDKGTDAAADRQAAQYLKRAIDENGLPNNAHYQNMLQLAALLKNDEKLADSVVYVDRFLSETKTNDVKAYQIKAEAEYFGNRYAEAAATVRKAMELGLGNDSLTKLLVASYQEMDKPAEAAKILEELVAKKPGDKALLQNLASAYQQADQDAKAGEVIDRMRSQGLLTDTKDYESAYRLMANIAGREKDAVALINEGLQKGILQPNHDVYAYIGNAYYNADQIPLAIEAWSKAAPLGKDGETYLNVGKLQASEERWNDAKAAAQQALAKGVRKPGDAWIVIARAEFGLGNKNAVLAAYREAAKYPETKAAAEKALRQAAGK
ncbi:tetratricopeptide repeat protein [Arenimonas sp.]|uniref:tetratricopeptide repeat protein n=1 Tax=Arenimonas sp. TaxID=1872635 RepID=UPI0039E5A302